MQEYIWYTIPGARINIAIPCAKIDIWIHSVGFDFAIPGARIGNTCRRKSSSFPMAGDGIPHISPFPIGFWSETWDNNGCICVDLFCCALCTFVWKEISQQSWLWRTNEEYCVWCCDDPYHDNQPILLILDATADLPISHMWQTCLSNCSIALWNKLASSKLR